MAFCPKCNGVMGTAEIECPHCGYDFESASMQVVSRRAGIAYSPMADIALHISMVSAVCGCVASVFVGIASLLHGEILAPLIYCPIAFFLQLGMFVVFVRVRTIV
jgi:uncharacterized membrane protein YvbJ